MTKTLKRNQQGFTLIELLVGIAIFGVIGGAMTTIVLSTIHNTDDNNGRVQALSGIESAAHQIAEDGMAAESFVIPGDQNSITLTWESPAAEGGNTYEVVYSLSGQLLQRQYTVDGGAPTLKTLAEDVSDIEFTAQGDGAFKVSITSSGGGSRISETREYDVALRLD